VSTSPHAGSRDLEALLDALETDPFLFEPEQVRERLLALDTLDAAFGGSEIEDFPRGEIPPAIEQAMALQERLEGANEELFRSLRAEIVRLGSSPILRPWFERVTSRDNSGRPLPGLGFDLADELLSGILDLREPGEAHRQQLPEVIAYQPTPARHIVDLIAAGALSDDDTLIDLGSGLGHVPLLVALLTGIRTVGVEMEPAFVATAQECADRLQLRRVSFIAEDARSSDLSAGTVFYLYTPFTGSILNDVLSSLRSEAVRRPIRLFSLGPVTHLLRNESWLDASTAPDTERITIFRSR
jgi:hypothetical protein